MNYNLRPNSIELLKKQYIEFLKDNITYQQINKDVISVVTPFLDQNNDYTEIYIFDNHDGTFKLTDCGYTIQNLEMSGVEFDSKRRSEILRTTLNRFGMSVNDDLSLSIITSLQDMPKNKHTLIQCMLAISNLYVVNRNSVVSLFADDVASYFDKNGIRYSRDVSFRGKSGLTNSYEFLITKSPPKYPERIIKVVSDPSKKANIELAIISFADIYDIRSDPFKPIVILNDLNKPVKSDYESALSNYNISAFSWKKIEQHKQELAS